jgi:hypothetical protein
MVTCSSGGIPVRRSLGLITSTYATGVALSGEVSHFSAVVAPLVAVLPPLGVVLELDLLRDILTLICLPPK